MPDEQFTARSAFAGLAVSAATRGQVFVRDRDGLGLATVLLRKGQRAAAAQCVRQLWNIELPSGPRRSAAGAVAFAGTGPHAWLATCENGANGFAAQLRSALAGVACVSDQTDGYATLRLWGPKVRDTLLKLVSIDLHPDVFPPGRVAGTLAAHMGLTVWRLDDDEDGSPVFEVAVFRSLAGSFWQALSESAAEFGLVVQGPGSRAPKPSDMAAHLGAAAS